MTIAVTVDPELNDRLTNLAHDLGIPRTLLCARLLSGCLRNTNEIDAWKDAVIGPRFSFMEAAKRGRRPRTPKPAAVPAERGHAVV